MMNEFLELEFWRIIGVRVEDTLVVVQSWRTFLGAVLSSYARMSFGALSNCDKIRNSLRGALVYTAMPHGRVDLCSLLPRPYSPTVLMHSHGNLSHPVLGKFRPVFTQPKARPCALPCVL
ncbi:hypothetical protein GOBAR_AA15125 [Gossypium barbadense]|uniref:Uncharacterized protein n=1 Tax=Gossypium barbadense TaxID=3634 RepID=A0A2P5XQG1_GOSBA|nr:hypothetical protein GOBAR_AA15125 [Gossypium barbadense]